MEFFCSLLVGLAFGIMAALLFKYLRYLTESVIIEVALIIYIGYGSFTVCELLGLSGVLSVLATGALMAYYNIYNLSTLGSVTSKYIFYHNKNNHINIVISL
jgi:sodium/hydrogen exchanger-like protein 6/7/sodium/hydrogen exchanger 8